MPAHYELALSPSGYFWAVPHIIGSSHDELIASGKGEIPDQRVAELRWLMDAAMRALWSRDAEGHC